MGLTVPGHRIDGSAKHLRLPGHRVSSHAELMQAACWPSMQADSPSDKHSVVSTKLIETSAGLTITLVRAGHVLEFGVQHLRGLRIIKERGFV